MGNPGSIHCQALGEESVRAAFPNATIMRPAPVFGPEDSLLLRFAALVHHDSQLPFLATQRQCMQVPPYQ